MATVANLFIRISASTSEFEKSLKSAEASFNRTGAKWQSVGAALTKSVTLPMLAVGAGAIKAAVDFESSFAGIRKTVDATGAQFKELETGMREMAKIKPVDVNTLNKIGEIGGQLGIGANGILAFTDVVSDMTIATELSADAAASALARIATLTKTPKEGFRALGDTIAALGDAGSSTEAQIVDFAQRIAGTGTLAGLTANQILAISASMSDLGIEADAGGTAVQKVLSGMITAVEMGGDKLEMFGAAIGKSGEEFRQMFNADAGQAFVAFIEGLGTKGRGAIPVLQDLFGENERLMRAFLGLSGASGKLQAAFDTAAKSTGKLKSEVGIFADTTESKLRMFYNAINDVGITLGQVLIPELTKLQPAAEGAVRNAAELVKWFSQLPQPVKEWSLSLAGLAALLGPIAGGIGLLLKGVAGIAGVLRASGIAGAFSKIGAALLDIYPLVKGFGWEGMSVGLQGVANAIFLVAKANPVGFFITLGGIVKSLGATWVETFAIMAAPPIGMIMNSWRKIREGYDLYFGDMGMPGAPRAPKAKVNATGFGLPIDQAMALLDQPFSRGGKGGGGGGKKGGGKSEAEQMLERIKALTEELNGGKAAKELQELAGAWKALSPEMRSNNAVIGMVVEKFRALGPNLINVPDYLKPIVAEFNALAFAAGRFADVDWEAGLSSLDGIGAAIKGTPLEAMLDLSAFERADDGKGAELLASMGLDFGKPDQDQLDQIIGKWGKAFKDFGDELGDVIVNSFSGGGDVGKSIGGLIGGRLTKGLGDTVGSKLGGLFGGGAGKGIGSLLGGIAGSVIPGLGTLLGGLAGGAIGKLFGGLFGGGKKKKEELAKMNEARNQLLEQVGGMERLKTIAEHAGISVDKLFSTTKIKEFDAEMANVQAAVEAYQEKIEGIVTGLDKAVSGGEIISADMWKDALANLDSDEVKDKLIEVFDKSVSQSAEGFNKIAQNFELIKAPLSQIGVLADAAFGGLLANGASVVEAINQMGPGLDHIQQVLEKTGQTPTGPLADILNYQKVVEANAGIFELLSGVDDMLIGLANSGLLTQERFSALGQTITQAFTQLTANGVAGATAFELMSGPLQQLWMLQKQFGFAVDANTQSLLTQAEKQGVVGAQMQSTEQKILDVLVAIGQALGATIPQALLGLPPVAEQAAAGINAAFDPAKITPKFQAIADAAKGALDQIPNQIPMELRMKLRNETGVRLDGINAAISAGIRIQPFASGGIVTSPTLGLVGEAGPEAVIPLDKMDRIGGHTINLTVNGTADREFAKLLAREIAKGGDTKTSWQGALR